MYCSSCGAKLEQNAIFCHSCGSKVVKNDNYNYQNNNKGVKQKNKFIAGLLAIFLGTLGIHNFYLGYNAKGVTQLLLFVFWLGWLSFFWSIVETVMIFLNKINTDANGIPLSENM